MAIYGEGSRKYMTIVRREIEEHGLCLSNGSHLAKPTVYRLETTEGPVVVKDVGGKNLLLRWTLGLWLIEKEWRTYSKLRGIDGIPRVIKRIDRFAFAMEFIPGRPLERKEKPPSSFWTALERVLDEIHRQGVVHLDLRHKGNILITDEGKPFLIDFNSSFSFRNGWPLKRFFFPFLRKIDRAGFLKLKQRLAPSSMSAEERCYLARFNRLRRLWIFN